MRKLSSAVREAKQLGRLLAAGVRVYAPEAPAPDKPSTVSGQIPPGLHLADQDPTAALDEYEICHLGEHLESVGDRLTLDRILRLEWGEPIPQRREQIFVEPQTPGPLARLLRRRPAAPDRPTSPNQPTSPDGIQSHPAWFEAKNQISRPDEFVEDVQRAWRLAANADVAELASTGTAVGVGLQARYALVLASVNSYASAIPKPLIVALVRAEMWTAPQAVAYARRVADTEERLDLLTALLPVLPEPLLSDAAVDAFGAARQLRAEGGTRKIISGEEPQLSIPYELAAHLPAAQVRQALGEVQEKREPLLQRLAELGHLNEAVSLAGENQSQRSSLIPFMTEHEVWRHLAEPDEPHSVYPRGLFLRLAAFGHVDEAMEYARTLEFPGPRNDVFLEIAPHFPPDAVDRAKAAAVELLRPEDVVLFLGAVAKSAQEPDRARLLDEALAMLPGIRYEGPDLLAHLIPQLDERQLDLAEALLRTTQGDSYSTLQGLFALARASTGERRDRALRSALKSSPRDAGTLMGRLLPAGWPAVDPAAALQASIDAGCAVPAMEYLAPHLPKSLLARAFSAATRVDTAEWQWLRFARRVAVALAGVEPGKGLAALASLSDPEERALGIMDLAETLPASHLEAALDIACGIPGGDERVPALRALAPYLPKGLLGRALDACHGEYERMWASGLESFAPYLTPDLVRAAVTEPGLLKDPERRARAYVAVIAHLPLPDLWELERLVRTLIESAAFSANHALAKLAEGFAARGEHQHAVDLLRDVQPVSVPSPAVDAVIAMGETLPAELLGAAFEALGDERTMTSLAPAARRLAAPRRQEWFEAALRHAVEQGSPKELALLSVTFGEPTAEAVLDEAEEHGVLALGTIAILAAVLPAELIGRAAALARSRRHRFDASARTRALLALAERQHQQGGEPAESLLYEAIISALSIESYRDLGTDFGHKSELWRKLRSELHSLPRSRQHSLVVQALAELSKRDRDSCLEGLGEMLPLVGKLGGSLGDIMAAAVDVGRWWP
jgi:hypothetical protein